MGCVMEVIIPFSRVISRRFRPILFVEPREVAIILRRQVDMPIGDPCPDETADLIENIYFRYVLDLVNCIKSQAVKPEFFQPVKSIIHEIVANRRDIIGDGTTPGRLAFRVEK